MQSCYIYFSIILTCLIVQAYEPIFSSEIHVQNSDSILFSLYNESYVNKSIHEQVNDVCFMYRIHGDACHKVMSFVFSYIPPSVYHISLVYNRIDDNDMDVAQRMTKELHYSDRYMELSCKDTTIIFNIIASGLDGLDDIVVYNIGAGLNLALSSKYIQVSFVSL